MKNLKTLSIVLVMLLALALTACVNADAGNNPAAKPPAAEPQVIDPPVTEPTVGEPPVEDNSGLPPFAAVKARLALAAELGISQDEVVIVSQEQVEWMDSCLGLGGMAESCALVTVPGWQVELSAKGEAYTAHTDEFGGSIRFEEINQPPDIGDTPSPEAAFLAQEALAAKLGVPVSEVAIISSEHTDWPDGCLGLGGPDTMCTMAIVPGWRVELSAEGRTYFVRSDEIGGNIHFE